MALPDTDGLTAEGRPLGPAHYTAYEMIRDPSSADAHPADVYSLGKTLWVLGTDQRFPPEGHQPAGTRGFEIGDFRTHAHSGPLDQEVDLMTRIHPEERPSSWGLRPDQFSARSRFQGSARNDVHALLARATTSRSFGFGRLIPAPEGRSNWPFSP